MNVSGEYLWALMSSIITQDSNYFSLYAVQMCCGSLAPLFSFRCNIYVLFGLINMDEGSDCEF